MVDRGSLRIQEGNLIFVIPSEFINWFIDSEQGGGLDQEVVVGGDDELWNEVEMQSRAPMKGPSK